MKVVIKIGRNLVLFSSIFVLLTILATLVMAAEYQSSSVTMNATVSNTVSINVSADALDRGVLFGSLTVGTNNNMAENDTTNTGNVTDYNIGNAPTTTGDLNFWNYAPDMDRSGNANDVITIANVTHEANTTEAGENVNMTVTTDGTIAMTTTYAAIGGPTASPCSSVSAGSVCWVAYWLDVPTNIPDGTYNTTYYYCGNLTIGNTACS